MTINVASHLCMCVYISVSIVDMYNDIYEIVI